MSFFLDRVAVEGVRNLSPQRFNLDPGANVFYGPNGSGKTSVLEAIHLLGVGRSFRTASARALITHGLDTCLVQGNARVNQRAVSLGLRRYRSGEVEIRLNGQTERSVSILPANLPLVVVEPNSIQLLTGVPEIRRRFMDGTVFHVEHSFLSVWQRYHRALRQRNACLRRGTLSDDNVWRSELARLGEDLAAKRLRVVTELGTNTATLLSMLSPELPSIELTVRQGWESSITLAEALDGGQALDRKQGFTRSGPHRGDLKLTVEERPVAEVLSRGQLKLVAIALKLAQGQVLGQSLGNSPVFLVDDLVSELDSFHAGQVFGVLRETGGQVLITAVSGRDIENLWQSPDLKMFHVEQGKLTAV